VHLLTAFAPLPAPLFARYAAASKAKIAAAGAKVGAVLGSSKTANVLAGGGLATSIAHAASQSTVCGDSCAGTVPGGAAAARTSVNGCDNEGCLCSAVGAGVHPNVFDNTCGTFFHCPGPKRPCGPGTLFNPETRVCDWPYNVNCMAVRA
jgi:hypothetical protein